MKAVIWRDVVYNETVFNYNGDTNTRDTGKIQVDSKEATRPAVYNQCPDRQRWFLVRYGHDEFVDTVTEDVHHAAYNVSQILDPKPMQEALTSEHAKECKAAADAFDSLMANETWEPVSYPVVINQ